MTESLLGMLAAGVAQFSGRVVWGVFAGFSDPA
jgi:hypothetical protein